MARVLVIEDERLISSSLGKILTSAGHVVAFVRNGRAGLKRFIQAQSELVIIDLEKSGRKGIETIIELRKVSPHLAIIAMSGFNKSDPLLLIAKIFGAKGTIKKSFSASQLLSAVDRALHT